MKLSSLTDRTAAASPPVDAGPGVDEACELQLGQSGRCGRGSESADATDLLRGGRTCLERGQRRSCESRRRDLRAAGRGVDAKHFEHVFGPRDEDRADPDERVRAAGKGGGDLARNGEHFAAFLECEVRRDQRAAAITCFDHHRCLCESGDDPVPRREAPGRGRDAGWVLRDDEPGPRNLGRERRVRTRVVAIDAAPEHGNGRPTALQRAAVRPAVDASGKPGDDDDTGRSEVAAKRPRDVGAVVRAAPGADDRDRPLAEELRLRSPAQEEPGRGVVDRPQSNREVRVRAAEPAKAAGAKRLEVGRSVKRSLEPCVRVGTGLRVDRVGVARGGEDGESELVQGVLSSRGER